MPGEKGSQRRRYLIVLAGFLAMFISYGSLYCFGVFFKPVSAQFDWTRAETSGAYSLFQIMHGVIAIIVGRIGDRFNPRLVISICGVFLGSGYLLMSQINSLWQFYVFYGVLVSTGMTYYVPLISTVARSFTSKRGMTTGIILSGTGVGLVVMPPLATRLISDYGWSQSYLILGALVIVIILIVAQFVRAPRRFEEKPVDGSVIINQSAGTPGLNSREALRVRPFWLFSIALFCFIFAQQLVLTHIVPFAMDVGISAVSAAGILSAIGGISITGRIGLGIASDRTSSKLAWLIALASASVATLWLLFAPRELWGFYLFAVLFGFGYGGVMSVQSPMVAELFGLRSHGAIYGLVLSIGMIGGAVGPVVGGSTFDITGNYQIALIITAVLGGIGVALGWLLHLERGANTQRQT